MRKIVLIAGLCVAQMAVAQLNIDTLAFQDFEVVPASPVWTFTGPVIYNSGFSTASAAPPNSPLGIGGSRAWETTTNSGGLVLDFANVTIPPGYDSLRVRFNLAAMNLNGSSGGPDNLDYVLIAYSTDGGTTYVNRMRIRGSSADNSFWAYSATGYAKNYYQPATEQMFQPTTIGLQTTFGYSTCEIVFPGTVTQVQMRITGRSSSSSDTWLVDNLVLTGENNCINSTSSITAVACGSYTAPSGSVHTTSGTFNDIIPNTLGCDSVITINLTVNNASSSSMSATACGSYTAPSGSVYTTSGTFNDTIANSSGCDSVITINLTVNNASSSSMSATVCDLYTAPSGSVYTTSGIFNDTIPNSSGCDSVITISLTVNNATTASISPTVCDSYTAPSGTVYTTSGTFNDTIANSSGCDSVITINLTVNTVDVSTTLTGATLSSNASGAQYQWLDCNNGYAVLAGETGQSYNPVANGNYAVAVTQNGCTDTSACVQILTVGITTPVTGELFVAPNPVTDVLILQTVTPLQDATIRITDMQGRVLRELFSQRGKQFEMELDGLGSGVYFIAVTDGNSTLQTRFVKK